MLTDEEKSLIIPNTGGFTLEQFEEGFYVPWVSYLIVIIALIILKFIQTVI